MAAGGEKRGATTHRTPSQKRAHAKVWNSTPKQKALNRKRKKARYDMEKAGKVKKGDGKHVDHKRGLSSGGSNKKSNMRVTSARTNLRKQKGGHRK